MTQQNKVRPDVAIEQFCKDVAGHKMTVLKDDGLYRHVRFAVPHYFENAFELVTVPGSLMIRGDMGCYVFERIDDMFAFFRTKGVPENEAVGIRFRINPTYWAEKLASVSRHEGLKAFSWESYAHAVREAFESWKAYKEPSSDAEKEMWALIEDELLDEEMIRSVELAQKAVFDFSHDGPDFSDFFEVDIEQYTHHFLWCCAAIAWGVAYYDEAQTKSADSVVRE